MLNTIKTRFISAVIIVTFVLCGLAFPSSVMARERVDVTGVCVSSTDVTLSPGGSYQITAYVLPDNATNTDVYFYSTDSSVASVDQDGVIRANGNGACTIVTETDEGDYEAHTCVRVNGPAAVQPASSDDQYWDASASNAIMTAAPNSVLNFVASYPVNLDLTVVNALQMRPDVGFTVSYDYCGHSYLMSVPAGYDLTTKLDCTGHINLLSLAAVNDGLVTAVMTR